MVLRLLTVRCVGGLQLGAGGSPSFANFASLHLFLVLRAAEIAVRFSGAADKGSQKAEGGQTSDHFGHGVGLQVKFESYRLWACPRQKTARSKG